MLQTPLVDQHHAGHRLEQSAPLGRLTCGADVPVLEQRDERLALLERQASFVTFKQRQAAPLDLVGLAVRGLAFCRVQRPGRRSRRRRRATGRSWVCSFIGNRRLARVGEAEFQAGHQELAPGAVGTDGVEHLDGRHGRKDLVQVAV